MTERSASEYLVIRVGMGAQFEEVYPDVFPDRTAAETYIRRFKQDNRDTHKTMGPIRISQHMAAALQDTELAVDLAELIVSLDRPDPSPMTVDELLDHVFGKENEIHQSEVRLLRGYVSDVLKSNLEDEFTTTEAVDMASSSLDELVRETHYATEKLAAYLTENANG